MRELHQSELSQVSGAGYCCDPCDPCCEPAPSKRRKSKNNNGYGNGPESGPPPGNSGANNPQLIDDNLGPRGPR